MFALVAKQKSPGQERKVIKVAVTEVGHSAIKGVADLYDMKEQAVAGRIYEWFFRQDDIVQRAILGMLKGFEVDAARRFMERFGTVDPSTFRLGSDVQTEPDPPPATPAPQHAHKAQGASRRERPGESK